MIKCENICKSFDGRTILEDISVEFESGKTNLIIGRSGSGKTVLLKTLVGLHEPDTGSIFYDEKNYTALSFAQRKEVRRELGMIFQGGALLDSSTVYENVRLPLDMFTNQSSAEKDKRVKEGLARVELSHAGHLYPSELSGGMIKRAAIARAIVLNPKYLFCDEPNSGLDPISSRIIDRLISDITHEYGITTIVNTHDMGSVRGIGEQVLFIHDGRAEWTGTGNTIDQTDSPHLREFLDHA